jgi:hypothetical protein
MKEEAITDAVLRQFLLGKVDDEKRVRIESLCLTESTMRERAFAVEQELIEDYLEGSLSPEEREDFLLHYAQTAEQQRKLRITKSIKDWALEESATQEVQAGARRSAASTMTLGNRLREQLRPGFVLPIAAALILAVVLGVIWFNRRQEQQRHSAVEQELAQLNDPARLRDVPAVPDALELTPGTLRGTETQSELKLSTNVTIVELYLLWLGSERYPIYRAVVRRFDDEKAFTIPELHMGSDGKTIRLRLRRDMLRRGLYQISVSGITSDGPAGRTEEYQFTVRE